MVTIVPLCLRDWSSLPLFVWVLLDKASSIIMFHKEKSIQIKNSASALYNNLSVLRIAPRRLTYFTVVHANVVNMVSASWDGLNYSHRQLQSKEPNVATSTSLIMQVSLPSSHVGVKNHRKCDN